MLIPIAVIAAASAASALPPLVFICIRQAIKRSRQEIVRDLAAVFTTPSAEYEKVIPSFEFVKYKYYLRGTSGSGDPPPRDHTVLSWLIGSTPLVILLFICFYAVFSFVGFIVFPRVIPGFNAVNDLYEWNNWPVWMWSLCASFGGGYVFMIRAFYRAVRNFDLSPLSLVGASNNLVTGIIIAQILSHALLLPAYGVPEHVQFHVGLIITVLIISFAIGYFPESATRTLLRRSDLGHFKRENQKIYKVMFATPIEIIDGIDTEIRDRLADYHIKSTQNLAAANPLMLFVETPYGVYQIMDWVAQSQLCCSVGPDALIKLWKIGIRTLFDLERVATDEYCINPLLLREICKVLLPDLLATPDAKELNDAIIANIIIRLDDPHVHRLRQIYIKIGDRLGADNRRFSKTVRNCQDEK